MPKASSPTGKWQIFLFFLIALLVAVADQLTKEWIRSHLALGQSFLEAGWFRLTHVQNTGAAFGLFQGQAFSLSVVTLIGIVLLLLYVFFIFRRFPFLNSALSRVALGLVLGGTIGNLVDRIRFGYVTDFIDFTVWPAFNIADSAVVVGAILFAYLLLSSVRTGKRQTARR